MPSNYLLMIYEVSRSLRDDGKDLIFDELSSLDDVVAPAWVLASPQDFDRMQAFWGEPLSQIG